MHFKTVLLGCVVWYHIVSRRVVSLDSGSTHLSGIVLFCCMHPHYWFAQVRKQHYGAVRINQTAVTGVRVNKPQNDHERFETNHHQSTLVPYQTNGQTIDWLWHQKKMHAFDATALELHRWYMYLQNNIMIRLRHQCMVHLLLDCQIQNANCI